MSFTSLIFLCVFFPLAWLCWLAFSRKPGAGNLVLLVVSLLFYGFGAWQNLLILVLMICFVYFGALSLEGAGKRMKRLSCLFTVGGVLLVFLVYRYLPGLSQSVQSALPFLPVFTLAAPVGLSFYLFSLLSYYFDVYYQKMPVQKNIVSLGLYAAFFGRVNMGPIGDYAQFAPQLESHSVTRRKMAEGGALFLQGLVYKVVLADNFALVFGALSADASWLGSILLGFSYFFQLFFDFAGYSRMARGLGWFFGFEIPANFNKPYTARSVQDFWRRWHISLTSWFRKYVYIPLGGNRVSHRRWVLNLLAVWVLTGLWHGASLTFLAWGLWQAGLILLEHALGQKRLEKIPGVLRHLFVILSQLLGWTLFFSPGLGSALQLIGRYFGIGITSAWSALSLQQASMGFWLFAAGIFACSGLPRLLSRALLRSQPVVYPYVKLACYAAALVLCLAFLVSATSQTFLYAAF